MGPPAPLNSSVAPIRSGATSRTLRLKKVRVSRFGMGRLLAGHVEVGKLRVNRSRHRPKICDYLATAREHLPFSHCSVAKRRYLAIGFFETDGCKPDADE